MNMTDEIRELLRAVIHPESGENIVDAGIVESIAADREKITVALLFAKSRDPFAASIKRQVQGAITQLVPEMADRITVLIKEAAPRKNTETQPKRSDASRIAHVVAVASGKGGVGKSTVTANLALALAAAGYRVGILDADIYGPSQPKMFGVEGYMPDAVETEGGEFMVPAQSRGISLMSIGFFIKPSDALIWRGPMATNALKQMIHQTRWGVLDFLLIDLPPGTGDVHLSVLQELKLSGAVIVSTPQQVALADVVRGIAMFRAPKIEVPVLGIVENMAWFTPAELPDNRYYIFGREGARKLAEETGLELLGQIPIIQSVMDGGERGVPAAAVDAAVEKHYRAIADRIVDKLRKEC